MLSKQREGPTNKTIHLRLLKSTNVHLTETQVVGFALNELPSAEDAVVKEHLAKCDSCAGDMAYLMAELERYEQANSLPTKIPFATQLFSQLDRLLESQWPYNSADLVGDKSMTNPTREKNNKVRRSRTNTTYAQEAYAQTQSNIDPEGKWQVATYAVKEFKLADGEGTFVDAGSHCKIAWKALGSETAEGNLSHITVVTNSFAILSDWADPKSVCSHISVQLAGSIFDRPHLAFYGPGIKQILAASPFRAAYIYIGTSGIEFDQQNGARILFGYHGDDPEKEVKKLLFQCPCKKARIILATARKIGNAGGMVFDLLKCKHETQTPVFLLTTPPKKNTPEQSLYENAMRVYGSDEMQKAIVKSKLNFQWIEVDANGKAVNLTQQLVPQAFQTLPTMPEKTELTEDIWDENRRAK